MSSYPFSLTKRLASTFLTCAPLFLIHDRIGTLVRNPQSPNFEICVISRKIDIALHNRVVVRCPFTRKLLIGEIAALSGEKVKHYENFINSYVVIPQGHFWLKADYETAQDSRDVGPIPLALVEGQILCCVSYCSNSSRSL